MGHFGRGRQRARPPRRQASGGAVVRGSGGRVDTGAGIGADDDAYRAAGAKIAATAADIFQKCDMVVKVK
ncbi:MAG: hypothetical protein IJ127_17040, partial [Afipia sp.]|nr:hypothetical protein [Afipia sp.]